jgi:hypothetical protein
VSLSSSFSLQFDLQTRKLKHELEPSGPLTTGH